MAASQYPPPNAWAGGPPGPGVPPPRSRTSAGRIVAGVVGGVLLLPALGLLAAGGVVLWADQSQRADDGYLYTSSDAFSTPGHALVSQRIDLETGADWVGLDALGTARVEVTGTDAGKDIFVGVAPAFLRVSAVLSLDGGMHAQAEADAAVAEAVRKTHVRAARGAAAAGGTSLRRSLTAGG
jgi:hypothetical protein